MDALVWEAPGTMNMRQWSDPQPAAGEVLIDVAYAGICGSDLGGYLGHNALRVPPLVMGHEFSGVVVALGEGVGRQIEIGQKVTCNPMLACGECRFCRSDMAHLCTSRKLIGAHRPGAFAERVAAPQEAVYALPDSINLRAAAIVEPVAVAMRISRLAGDVSGETVLVIGAGPIGLLALQAIRMKSPARIFVSDIDPERLAMAESLGAVAVDPASRDLIAEVHRATEGLGAGVTIDAVGSAGTRAASVAATRSAGKVLLSWLHEEASAFPASEVIRREIEVKGAFCYTGEDFQDAIDAVAAGQMRLDPWIVEAPLSEGGHWFKRLVGTPGNVGKVLLIP